MRKHISAFISVVFAVSLALTALLGNLPGARAVSYNWDSSTPPPISPATFVTGDEVTIRQGAAGTLTVPDGVSITINDGGSAVSLTTNISINIGAGATVNWVADVTGRAAANAYVLTLSGGGTFSIDSGGKISNNAGSAGGTVYINSGVTLNVNSGGVIESPGSGSAVIVATNTTGARINVASGGRISSLPSGYAISDGTSFTTASSNNTQITIAGTLEAGSACAIRSSGSGSYVTVSGGKVTNAASNNANPAIYMVFGSGNNVTVNSGEVRSLSTGGYAIQTAGNLNMTGGTVSAINGRAINLVGESSEANVSGGSVSVVNSPGVAISTATTAGVDITNAKISISGGAVIEAVGTGTAIHITGDNSEVSVAGAGTQVLAKSGYAIDVDSNVKNDSVNVGAGAFVFAWGRVGGDDINNVIHRGENQSGGNNKLVQPVSGYVVAWNTTTGVGLAPYHYGTEGVVNDLISRSSGSVLWDDNGTDGDYSDDGIRYGTTMFHLNVEVYRDVYTLTVINGIDGYGTSVDYKVKEGTVIRITACGDIEINPGLVPPSSYLTNGNKFSYWDITVGGGSIGDQSLRDTTFTMPSGNATVTAIFVPRYLLHVDGLGAVIVEPRNSPTATNYAYYAEGDEIIIRASSMFAYWGASASGGGATGLIESSTSYITKYTMPGNSVTVTAYPTGGSVPVQNSHRTDVIGGVIITTTGGSPPTASDHQIGLAGTGLRLEPITPLGKVFIGWKINSGGGWFFDAGSPNAVYVMPDNDAEIEAEFTDAYDLTVIDGSATESGPFKATDKVHITADPAPAGYRFKGWELTSGSGTFDRDNASSTIFNIVDNATVRAIYEAIPPVTYDLWVWNGTPASHSFTAGDKVDLRANDPPFGMYFTGWLIVEGNPGIIIMNPEQSFAMPAEDVILVATYGETLPVGPDGEEYGYAPDSSGRSARRYLVTEEGLLPPPLDGPNAIK